MFRQIFVMGAALLGARVLGARLLGATVLSATVLGVALSGGAARSAELTIKPGRYVRYHDPDRPACGCRCGCLAVTHVRHREIAMTFSPESDPRRYDEPRYYWGPVRSYPRYRTWYDAD